MDLSSLTGRAPVSVVIPCYNCAGSIVRALASVAAQTWPPEEIIVVDDASCDGGATRRALADAAKAYGPPELRVIHLEENRGPGVARNVGWDAATQPYIAFLDADDSWHPRKVEFQLGYMLRNPDVDFCAHRWSLALREPGTLGSSGAELRVVPITARGLLRRNSVSTPTVMLRRELPIRFPAKRYAEDYFVWLALTLGGHKGVFLTAELSVLHKPPYGVGGLSGKLWRMELGELGTYWQLARIGLLPNWNLLWLVPWSLAKFVRRLAVSYFGQGWKA